MRGRIPLFCDFVTRIKYLRANPGFSSIILVDTVYPDFVGNPAF